MNKINVTNKRLKRTIIRAGAIQDKIKIRGLNNSLPKDSACEICSIDKPLDRCHIFAKRFIEDIKDIDEDLLAYDGRNILILCKNHHALFDRFDLDHKDFIKIWPKIDKILYHFASEVIPKVEVIGNRPKEVLENSKRRHIESMIGFISKFNIYGYD